MTNTFDRAIERHEDRLDKHHDEIGAGKAGLSQHEAVCAERYQNINRQLDGLRKLLIAMLTAVAGAGATVGYAYLKDKGFLP